MEANKEEDSGPGLDMMNPDEALAVNEGDEVKPVYKSYKKKYRKMRIKFDEVMRESNTLVALERQGEDTSSRLAIEIDRLMELLLDVNNSAQIPADKRINLNAQTPALFPVPDLITPEEHSRLGQHDTPEGEAIHHELMAIVKERAAEKEAAEQIAPTAPKSLAHLLNTIPHLTAQVSPELVLTFVPLPGHIEPVAYLTLDTMDEYLYEVDVEMGVDPLTHPRNPQMLDLALHNPSSVYNWLRKNKPDIFLQDGEGSEKSNGKPGSLRGAGKRSSMPAPSKPDVLEIVPEDGMTYDPTISGLEPVKVGKRKRDDDGGYNPKSGTPASGKTKKPRAKKPKIEGEPAAPSSRKKGKAKERVPSPMAVDPDTPGDEA